MYSACSNLVKSGPPERSKVLRSMPRWRALRDTSEKFSDWIFIQMTWSLLRECALGLEHLHDRGYSYERFLWIRFTRFTLREVRLMVCGYTYHLETKYLTMETATHFANVVFSQTCKLLLFLDLISWTEHFSPPNDVGMRLLRFNKKPRTERLPDTQPDFLSCDEWSLLEDMFTTDSAKIPTMQEVVHRMESLIQRENIAEDEPGNAIDVDVKELVYPPADVTIEQILQDMDEYCNAFEEFADCNREVYSRLKDLYGQLLEVPGTLAKSLVEAYRAVLWKFYMRVERRATDEYTDKEAICASATIANRNHGIHCAIDRLILKSPQLYHQNKVRQWHHTWARDCQQQNEILHKLLENPVEIVNEEESKCDRERESMLLRFEAQRVYQGSYKGEVPLWFIPPYQVELQEYIAKGSFGVVYRGTWLGTNVVVKQLLAESDETQRAQFRREADLWFPLNHPNLLKMYGACHYDKPFIVCEYARHSTIASFAKGKNVMFKCEFLHAAAKGLEHLHNQGIVHGDLKGNNILVCEVVFFTKSVAKLADFGLSTFSDCIHSPEGESVQGAFRWKAPECLNKSNPSFESDIYSFGMCIYQVLSGELPWGDLPDKAVIHQVTKEKKLPKRHSKFTDRQWSLINRLCCFDPKKRISASSLVELLEWNWLGYQTLNSVLS